MSKNFISTATAPNQDWTSSLTGAPSDLRKRLQEIMDSPAIRVTQRDLQEILLYSQDQLVEMFELGTSLDEARRKKRIEEYRSLRPHYALRNMEVGEEIFLPYETWGATRAAASYIKKNFGCVFQVKKVAPGKIESDIKVLRLS